MRASAPPRRCGTPAPAARRARRPSRRRAPARAARSDTSRAPRCRSRRGGRWRPPLLERHERRQVAGAVLLVEVRHDWLSQSPWPSPAGRRNSASACVAQAAGSYPFPADPPYEAIPFEVQGPPAVDNGRLTVHIAWADPANDWDVHVLDSTGAVGGLRRHDRGRGAPRSRAGHVHRDHHDRRPRPVAGSRQRLQALTAQRRRPRASSSRRRSRFVGRMPRSAPGGGDCRRRCSAASSRAATLSAVSS